MAWKAGVLSLNYLLQFPAPPGYSEPAVWTGGGFAAGFLLRFLRRHSPDWAIVGADCVRGQLERLSATMSYIPLLRFDLTACPLRNESLDAVVLLLENLIRSAGLEIPDKSHLGFFLYPAFRMVKQRNRKQINVSPEERSASSSVVLEARCGWFFSYPTGIRCLATCRRPQ